MNSQSISQKTPASRNIILITFVLAVGTMSRVLAGPSEEISERLFNGLNTMIKEVSEPSSAIGPTSNNRSEVESALRSAALSEIRNAFNSGGNPYLWTSFGYNIVWPWVNDLARFGGNEGALILYIEQYPQAFNITAEELAMLRAEQVRYTLFTQGDGFGYPAVTQDNQTTPSLALGFNLALAALSSDFVPGDIG